MSPKKSPGQAIGQLLDADGRHLLGRAVDLDWDAFRPHVTDVHQAPAVVLDRLSEADRRRVGTEDWVLWRPCLDNLCECQRAPSTEGLLDDFLALEEATPYDVERFIFERGAIAGCTHLRPHGDCLEILRSDTVDGTKEEAGAWAFYWEAPVAYRDYATLFRSILAIAAQLQNEEPDDPGLWETVLAAIPRDRWHVFRSFEFAFGVFEPLPTEPRELAERILGAGLARSLLGEVVDSLMAESPVSVTVQWQLLDERVLTRPQTASARDYFDERPRMRLLGETFGVLTYQLAVALQGSLFAVCSNCQRTYAPARKPQAGRDNYCPSCRDARKAAYKRRRRLSG